MEKKNAFSTFHLKPNHVTGFVDNIPTVFTGLVEDEVKHFESRILHNPIVFMNFNSSKWTKVKLDTRNWDNMSSNLYDAIMKSVEESINSSRNSEYYQANYPESEWYYMNDFQYD